MKRRGLSLGQREPLAVRAAVTGAVTAVLHMLVAFGLPIDDELETGIVGAVDGVGLLVLIWWARGAVVPGAKVIARVTTDGDVVAGEAAKVATGTALHVKPPGVTGSSPQLAERVSIDSALVSPDVVIP